MKLVIVESPTKAKTLDALLGKNYTIKASMGHIRDLPKSGLGVDVEHDYAPEYVVADKGKKVLTDLKKSAVEADTIVLATDPDREGEAIAWHLKELLSKKKDTRTFDRVVFHELTKEAINEAFAHPGKLDMALVDAQQARRVLDRLVGYKLSPLLWKKVRFGLSAGRVQSVAVRLIVEKERERDAFKAQEYWPFEIVFETPTKENFTAELTKKDDKKIEISNEKRAKSVESDLKQDEYSVFDIKKTQRHREANPPLKTSTLQQMMATVYSMNANKTMSAAQKLFEKGLITYHRTDSLNLSPQFIEGARTYIKKLYGVKYLPEKPNTYKTKSKNAQEAHEAIRPTDLSVLPASMKNIDELKVYTLVYKRALESQMNPAVYDQTSVTIKSKKNYELKANGSIITFEGWLKVGEVLGLQDENSGLNVLPEVNIQDVLKPLEIKTEQKFTQPPARFNDASLIKKLEEIGIGRPSTYAPTISTILARKYIKREGRNFIPEDVAYVVTDLLMAHFPKIIDYEFTAGMEEDLDEIANKNKEWIPVIREFYEPFEKLLLVKDKELQKRDVTNLGESTELCPDCGSKLIFKLGKYGKFLSCSNYPTCEFAKPLEEDVVKDENGEEITDFGKCTSCEDGHFVIKKGRFGNFLACNNYPKCKTTKPYFEKIGMQCPKCTQGDVIIKKAKGRVFYGCSRYPECDYSSWTNPLTPSQKAE